MNETTRLTASGIARTRECLHPFTLARGTYRNDVVVARTPHGVRLGVNVDPALPVSCGQGMFAELSETEARHLAALLAGADALVVTLDGETRALLRRVAEASGQTPAEAAASLLSAVLADDAAAHGETADCSLSEIAEDT